MRIDIHRPEKVHSPEYQNKQSAVLCVLLYTIGALQLACAWIIQEKSLPVSAILAASGLLVLALAFSFHYLLVYDDGDRLRIRFGPLSLFRTSIRYEDIQSAEVGTTTFLEGWGIHYSHRGGWVWNIWGWDCVVIHHRRGILRLGTNDAKALAKFLNSKIHQGNEEAQTV